MENTNERGQGLTEFAALLLFGLIIWVGLWILLPGTFSPAAITAALH